MKRIVPALLLVGFLGLTQTGCDQARSIGRFKTESAFSEWMEYYYKHRSEQLVWPALTFYSDSSLFQNVGRRLVVGEFFAEIFKHKPELMHEVIAKADKIGSDNTKSMAIRILWLTDTEESLALFERMASRWNAPEIQLMLPKMRGQYPRILLQSEIEMPVHVDKLWHIFYAGGRELPVKKMIDIVKYVDPITAPSAQQYALGEAAKNSLIHHAARHTLVIQICQKEIPFSQETTRTQLRAILSEANRRVLRRDVKPR